MPIPKYTYTGPLDHTVPIDTSRVKGKSIIITGGANGMGETFVRTFAAAGALVTFGDINDRGHAISTELNSTHLDLSSPPPTTFVQVDIRSWDQLKALFTTAKAIYGSIDIVIANAGISRSSGDSLWNLDPIDSTEPTKPDLNIVDVNLRGTFYTWKLAVFYFRRQPEEPDRDRCFIMTGSLVAYIDSPANWEYTATKYALLGFMRTARRSSWEQGIRINYVAPCYMKSAIRTKEYEDWLTKHNVEFGTQEDCAKCMMRIATDREVNGRSLMIVPRRVVKEGWKDVDEEDWTEGDGHGGFFKGMQEAQLKIIEDRWRDDWEVRVYKE